MQQDAMLRRIIESSIIDPLKDFHQDFKAALNKYDRIKYYNRMQLFIAGTPMALCQPAAGGLFRFLGNWYRPRMGCI